MSTGMITFIMFSGKIIFINVYWQDYFYHISNGKITFIIWLLARLLLSYVYWQDYFYPMSTGKIIIIIFLLARLLLSYVSMGQPNKNCCQDDSPTWQKNWDGSGKEPNLSFLSGSSLKQAIILFQLRQGSREQHVVSWLRSLLRSLHLESAVENKGSRRNPL